MDYTYMKNELYLYVLTGDKEYLKEPMNYFIYKIKERYFAYYHKRYPMLDSRKRIIKKIGKENYLNDIKKLREEFEEKLELCLLIFKSKIIEPEPLLNELFYFVAENRYLHTQEVKRVGRKKTRFYKNIMRNGIFVKIRVEDDKL